MVINKDFYLDYSTRFFTDAVSIIPKKTNKEKLEIKQLIFNPPATIIKWEDDTKTIVKTTENDEYNPVFGFLMAYYQKHSGLTKTQVGKFTNGLVKEFNRQQELKNKSK